MRISAVALRHFEAYRAYHNAPSRSWNPSQVLVAFGEHIRVENMALEDMLSSRPAVLQVGGHLRVGRMTLENMLLSWPTVLQVGIKTSLGSSANARQLAPRVSDVHSASQSPPSSTPDTGPCSLPHYVRYLSPIVKCQSWVGCKSSFLWVSRDVRYVRLLILDSTTLEYTQQIQNPPLRNLAFEQDWQHFPVVWRHGLTSRLIYTPLTFSKRVPVTCLVQPSFNPGARLPGILLFAANSHSLRHSCYTR